MEVGAMPEALEIPIGDLKDWLKGETGSIIEPLKERGESLLKGVRDRLNEVREVYERLLDGGEREMRKGDPKTYRSARAANRLARSALETINKIIIPSQVSYESLQGLYEDLDKGLMAIERERKEWYPHIQPYFIMDRRRLDTAFKSVRENLGELQTFSLRQYVKAKAVEDALFMINKLFQSLNELEEVEKRKKRMGSKGRFLEEKIAENQQRIAFIQNKGELSELVQVNKKVEELEEKLKHDLRYLQKPFFKFQSLARSQEARLPLDEAKKLSEYLSDPFEALAVEEEGHPLLKRILRKMNDAMVQGKLKLKSSRLRKAQEQINTILNDALIPLHRRCREAFLQRQHLLTSEAIAAFQIELEQLQRDLRELRKQKEFVDSRGAILDGEHERLIEKIEDQKRELESTVLKLTNKNIQVML